MGGLKPGAERICPRILERGEPAYSVRLEQGDRDKTERQRPHEQDDVAQPAAARPVGADKDPHHHDRGSEIPLQHQQDEHAGEHGNEGDEHMLEVAHAL